MLASLGVFAAVLAAVHGCGLGATIFNAAFLNPLFGGQFPLTPGPNADFVLVRCLNETAQNVEFVVTIERDLIVRDADGNPQIDDQGNFVTESKRETVRLITFPNGNASDLGVLFDCETSPVTFVGLGENLLPTDNAVFVGGEGPGGAAGVGVKAGSLNPLSLFDGNFNCGDTVLFQAFIQAGVAGNTGLKSFLLPGSEQPSQFAGPNTFANYQAFLESQVREEEP
jgi:hypothetical protein